MGLTGKQQAFVDAYLGEARFNATKAALLAGYSTRSAASIGDENLEKPEIKAALKAHFDKLAMPKEEVLGRLADIARGDVNLVLDVNGEPSIRVARENGATHLIKSYTETVTEGESFSTTRRKIELHDPQRALELIGRHHALFTDKIAPVDPTGKTAYTPLTGLVDAAKELEEWRKQQQQLLAQTDKQSSG